MRSPSRFLKQVSLFWCVLIFTVFISPLGFAQTSVYLKPDDALKLLFQNSKEVIQENKSVTPEVSEKAKKSLGYTLPKNSYSFYLGKTDGKVDGYAIIDDQVGKVLPITFITKITPEGKVAQVEIMVYRESHGGEVKSRRFLNQFREKALNDELRLHGNIVNVTGATLSSQALVVGVKRALALWQIYYGKN